MTKREDDMGKAPPAEPRMDRRDFLAAGAALGLGLLPGGASEAAAPPAEQRIRRRVTLGRTGLSVPDISMGCFKLRETDVNLVHAALDRGVTHFDTADTYGEGRSETGLGMALEKRRAAITITSKHATAEDESAESQMLALEGSLKRLRTDYIDIYLNHAVNDLARVENPEWPEFVARAKAQGKIRFAGMSGHGGKLTRCVDYVVENDLADVVLIAHAFAQDPDFFDKMKSQLALKMDMVAPQKDLPDALARARRKNIGIMAMKTLWGGKLNDMRPYETEGSTYAQSAFRWVLTSGHVDGLVVTMRTPEMMDEYLGASGSGPVDEAGLSLLERYHDHHAASQCRYGCSACLDVCPSNVPVSDVLRSRMYAVDYGDRAQADEAYHKLDQSAAACLSCSGAPCASACPHGIPIARATRDTHRLLGIT